ncbi:MAG: hypothetical protein WCJ94_04620 [bacterium]
MKKTIIIIMILAMCGAPVFAGDIGRIIGLDSLLGISVGAAIGTALSTPSYMDGGKTDGTTFLVGAGCGALYGVIFGLALGIFGLNEDINMKNKENSKVSIDRKERFVQYNAEKIGIQITQKF